MSAPEQVTRPQPLQDDWEEQDEWQEQDQQDEWQEQDQQDQQDDQEENQDQAPTRILDLLFIHDATGSQKKYIRETTQKCKEICALIRSSGKFKTEGGLRMGLIAYRDHPQRYVSANDFVCKDHGGFTYDEHEVLENLDSLTASGGGDLPEAVADALHNALQLEWRPNATKVAVLLTDAAPHGIGERKDAFPEGCPMHHDPLLITRDMAKKGITLVVVACEPSLSENYFFAKDFYTALANMTTGILFPLTKTELLSTFIIGASLETAEIDSLVKENKESIVKGYQEGKDVDDIVHQVYETLRARGQKITTIKTGTPYKDSVQASHNVKVFMEAGDLSSARKHLQKPPADRSPFIPTYSRSNPPTHPQEVEVTFKNLGDEIIEVILGEDIDKPDPQKWVVRPGFFLPCKFSSSRPYNFMAKCGRIAKTMGFYFTKQQQDMDWWKYFA